MPKDYATPILQGEGATDYARYMRTDTLLTLQRTPDQMVHRDELLFQTVHQSTELWLKLACNEALEAAHRIHDGETVTACRLMSRSSLALQLVHDQLEMLTHLTPWAFQTIRTVLGHGSGFESPGWVGVQHTAKALDRAITELLDCLGIQLTEIYQGDPDSQLFRLCEALVDWDERIALWRTRHYKVATRIIGHQVVGTKGTPVDTLTRLITHKHFPALWGVRTQLTNAGPMGAGSRP
jgi:tryptophan 2,3-dioxygenase